ncbi:MAG: hypothetical protein IPI58_02340 [Alphaproteobacteria bacterium]|nr:MAG: hypothetical protein IPI58_02340 [Alphaproteobacteria bacterium]
MTAKNSSSNASGKNGNNSTFWGWNETLMWIKVIVVCITLLGLHVGFMQFVVIKPLKDEVDLLSSRMDKLSMRQMMLSDQVRQLNRPRNAMIVPMPDTVEPGRMPNVMPSYVRRAPMHPAPTPVPDEMAAPQYAPQKPPVAQ